MRLIVARCQVTYTGRLNAFLPEATRLVIVKADGTVMVWSDLDGYKVKPLKCKLRQPTVSDALNRELLDGAVRPGNHSRSPCGGSLNRSLKPRSDFELQGPRGERRPGSRRSRHSPPSPTQ